MLLTTSARRWRPRRGGFRDKPLGAILVHMPILNKASSRGSRDHLVNGIVVSTLSAIRTSSKLAMHVLSSRVFHRHHDREPPTTLP